MDREKLILVLQAQRNAAADAHAAAEARLIVLSEEIAARKLTLAELEAKISNQGSEVRDQETSAAPLPS